MTTLTELKKFHDDLSETEQEEVLLKLKDKYMHTDVTKDIDIISDATLPFLLVLDAIEELPRKGSKNRSKLALDFLNAQGADELAKLGIQYCEAKTGIKTYTISYVDLGTYLQGKNTTDRDLWRGVYLIINAIFVKEERYVSAWFDTAKFFYGNFLSETYLVDTIPGLSFNNKGVRHDMLCATSGTADADFLYTEFNITYTAEFKLPTKTISALAAYGYKNPSYIYNANILFTYDIISSKFYKIDYTIYDYNTGKPYTITVLDITSDSSRIIKS